MIIIIIIIVILCVEQPVGCYEEKGKALNGT